MKRLFIATLLLLSIGCPAPTFVDIFNNTGAPLEIRAFLHELHTVDTGQSARIKAWALFDRFEGPDADGRYWPILGIKVRDRCVDHRFKLAPEAWLPGDDGIDGIFVQIDSDLSVRYAERRDEGPISPEEVQPVGWPLRPRPPSSANDTSAANVTFFRSEGRGSMSVFVDDDRVAFLPESRYFTISLDPGRTRFSAETEGNDPIFVDLERGRQYYVRVHKKRWAVGEDVEVVDEMEAGKTLPSCTPINCEFSFDRRVHEQ